MAYSPAMHLEPVRRSAERIGAYFTDNAAAGAREFLVGFFELLGVQAPLPDPLPPALETTTGLLMRCRWPWTAEIPVDDLARAPFRTLVVSGGHSPVFEAICDVLAARLGGERTVIAGAGHSVPRTGQPFNDRLVTFLSSNPGDPR